MKDEDIIMVIKFLESWLKRYTVSHGCVESHQRDRDFKERVSAVEKKIEQYEEMLEGGD